MKGMTYGELKAAVKALEAQMEAVKTAVQAVASASGVTVELEMPDGGNA